MLLPSAPIFHPNQALFAVPPSGPAERNHAAIRTSFRGGRVLQRRINKRIPRAKLRWQARLWERRAWPLRIQFETSPKYAEFTLTPRCACARGSFIFLDSTNWGRELILANKVRCINFNTTCAKACACFPFPFVFTHQRLTEGYS